jgi:Tfp pilus assembly protein PilF
MLRLSAVLFVVTVLTRFPGGQGNDTRAVQHLVRGNEMAMAGDHRAAIVEWEKAAEFRPDSNVPWNNMANSYTSLGDNERALEVVEEACKRGIDHLSATTAANVYRAHKLWEKAEQVLLTGIEATIRSATPQIRRPLVICALLLFVWVHTLLTCSVAGADNAFTIPSGAWR